MELNVTYLLFIISGIVAGGIITWLILRPELARLRRELQIEIERRSAAEAKLPRISELESLLNQRDRAIATFQDERTDHLATMAALEKDLTNERNNAAEKLAVLDDAQKKLKEAFDALAAQALNNNNEQFLQLAQQKFNTIQESAKGELETRKQAIEGLLKPLDEKLATMDAHTRVLEQARTEAYSGLKKEISMLGQASTDLRTEAANLAKALSSPGVRGRWGEIQLRRILELAGMVKYCDFVEQKTTQGEDSAGRPDVIVNLPNNWRVAVDSKVPYDAFREAVQTGDDSVRGMKLKEHARTVRGFIDRLSRKAYSESIQPSPDHVIMLIPGESFYYAALEQDPQLLEYGAEQNVLVVSPMGLIGLLRSVAYGWREEKLAENAREISNLAKQLYDRIGTFVEHFVGIGSGLQTAVNAFDKAGRSLKSRVLVTTQKFKDLGTTTAENIPPPREIEMPPLLAMIEDTTPIVELPESETEIGAVANGR